MKLIWQDHQNTETIVGLIANKVAEWRKGGFIGVSATTEVLLNHWILSDKGQAIFHRGDYFRWQNHQEEAVLTTIYLAEVAKVKSRQDIVTHLNSLGANLDAGALGRQNDPWLKLGLELATGTGKTKIASLLFTWALLNAMREPNTLTGNTGIMLAPGLIVKDRLRQDFLPEIGPNIFEKDPIIPDEFQGDWICILGDREENPHPCLSNLLVTNIHQLDPLLSADKEPEEPKEDLFRNFMSVNKLSNMGHSEIKALNRAKNLIIINDEAHHVHDERYHRENKTDEEGLSWHAKLKKLHDKFGIGLQIDLSATLYEEKVTSSKSVRTPFFHKVYSFGLKEAINARIVKRPYICRVHRKTDGKAEPLDGLTQITRNTGDPWIDHNIRILAGIAEWKRKKQAHLEAKDGKNPVLMIVCDSTDKDAERDQQQIRQIVEKLKDWVDPEWDEVEPSEEKPFSNLEDETERLLQVDITKKAETDEIEWARIRKECDSVDAPTSKVRAIASVLMLREGWDVKNIEVIVPLRPCKSMTLVTQTMGRGLRKITGISLAESDDDNYVWCLQDEELIVINHPSFNSFLEDLEATGIKVGDAPETAKDTIAICVDPTKAGLGDMEVPFLLPQIGEVDNWQAEFLRIVRTELPKWEGLTPRLRWQENIDKKMWETIRIDFIKDEAQKGTEFEENTPYVESLKIVLNWARTLCREVGIGYFAESEIAQGIKAALEEKVFERTLFQSNKPGDTILSYNLLANLEVKIRIDEAFVPILNKIRDKNRHERPHKIEVKQPKWLTSPKIRVAPIKESDGYILRNPKFCCMNNVVFNMYNGGLEYEFAQALEKVASIEKEIIEWLYNDTQTINLTIPCAGMKRGYRPDFLVRCKNKRNYIIEIKGKDATDVSKKKLATENWIAKINAGLENGEVWEYIIVWGNHSRNDIDLWLNQANPTIANLKTIAGKRLLQ